MSRRTSLLLITVACSSLWLSGAPLVAQDAKVVKIAITPSQQPLPSLKFQLLPPYGERLPGNAAVRYARAALHYRPDEKVDTEVSQWLALPPAEFRKPETLKKVEAAGTDKIFAELERAARLQSCDWELPIREQFFFAILLPEVQEMRRLMRYTALKARREIATGRFAEAIATLQVGYAMSRHVGSGPTLINGLVGMAGSNMLDQVVLDLAQTPGAPSLYWALSFQPRPFIDPRPGVEAEMASLFLSFPELTSVREKPTAKIDDAAAVQRLFDKLFELVAMTEATNINDAPLAELTKAAGRFGIVVYAMARKPEMQTYLQTCGWSKQRVEELSDAALLLAFTRVKYEELRDLTFRGLSLPYWQAAREVEAADRRLQAAKQNREEILPLAALLLPAANSVAQVYARSERRLDVLRIVEGLRLYVAKHDGKLPKSLEEVTEVPLPPLDLITGKAFEYSLADDGTARLTLPGEMRTAPQHLIYEISVAEQK